MMTQERIDFLCFL